MGIRTIAICFGIAFGLCQGAYAADELRFESPAEPTSAAAADTLKTADQRKRERMKEAFGKDVTDVPAEGGMEFDPFSGESLAKRHNPYTYSVNERDAEMKRKMGADSIFIQPKPWYEKMFIGAFFGASKLMPLNRYSYKTTVNLGAMAGYRFNDLHSVRLAMKFGKYRSEDDIPSAWKIDILADYMFNLSNYMYGVNAERFCDFSPIVGLGISYAKKDNWSRVRPTVRGGLNVSKNLSDNARIFIEPYMSFMGDGGDEFGYSNPRRYDIEWGFLAGVTMDMRANHKSKRLFMPDFNPNIFVDFTVGPNFNWVGNFGNTMTKSLGSNYQLMVGKWFDPLWGARIGTVSFDFLWDREVTPAIEMGGTTIRPEVTKFHRGGEFCGRIELMFRPLNLIPTWRELPHRFDMNVSAGFDIGWYQKTGIKNYGNMVNVYIGYTGAIDLLYQIAPGTHLLLQPRIMFANFSVGKANFGKEGNYTDKFGSLNFGIRIQRPVREERINFYAEDFKPFWEIGFIGGTQKYINEYRYVANEHWSWLVGANVAYNFSYLHSAMVEFEYNRMYRQNEMKYEVKSGSQMIGYTGFGTRKYNFGTFKIGYRLNLANLIMSPNYDRRKFNLYGIIGPEFNVHFNTTYELNKDITVPGTPIINDENFKGNTGWGFFAGFLVSYNVHKNIALTVRPEAQWSFTRSWFGVDQVHDDVHQRTFMVKVDAGVTFTF
ncbi:MAG: hypothetical protein HUK00_02795 [Bacteroidaceae bacterium]|nr:hypothetical protein [Bacteroidaceae bacterium]